MHRLREDQRHRGSLKKMYPQAEKAYSDALARRRNRSAWTCIRMGIEEMMSKMGMRLSLCGNQPRPAGEVAIDPDAVMGTSSRRWRGGSIAIVQRHRGLKGLCRVDGAGRPKFDVHTGMPGVAGMAGLDMANLPSAAADQPTMSEAQMRKHARHRAGVKPPPPPDGGRVGSDGAFNVSLLRCSYFYGARRTMPPGGDTARHRCSSVKTG